MEKHFTASALIIHEKKVLLVYHKKLGVWLYPGGHIESNETPDRALFREVAEETGLTVEIIGEKDINLEDKEADVAVLSNPYCILCERVGDHYHNDLVYLCRIIGKSKKLEFDNNESGGIGFFGAEELEGLKLFPNFSKLLKKVLSERLEEQI